MADLPETAVVTPLKVTQRLSREGRWAEVEPVRDAMMREARQGGMTKEQAQEWTYAELDRMYPPLPKPEPELVTEQDEVTQAEQPAEDATVAVAVEQSAEGAGVSSAELVGEPRSEADVGAGGRAHAREGFGRLPRSWPPLPDNAPLPVELGWVQAQRLWIVEERNGQSVVRLNRASSPAPSRAALGWLDTAIHNPAKWADICAKGLGQQDLDTDLVKRERRSIDEVRALLAETVAAAKAANK